MPSLLTFWAKLGAATYPDTYHPVLCHLIDVATVARRLWDDVLRGPVKDRFARALGLDDVEMCGRWVALWVGAHDIGKLCPWFQAQGNSGSLVAQLVAAGMVYSGGEPHGTVSTAILADLLRDSDGWPGIDEDLARRIAIAVGGHHGILPTTWDDLRELMLKEPRDRPWQDLRREMLRELAVRLGVTGGPPKLVEPANQSPFMLLAGLTSVADWIGSNQTFFKSAIGAESECSPDDISAYYRHAEHQADEALRTLGWRRPDGVRVRRDFRTVFADVLNGNEPRPLQTTVERIANELTAGEPALILVEAPMGEGKTEAALYVAHVWHARDGQGTYVALPTMATSNQMFDRVERFLRQLEGAQNLMLLHGKSLLNDLFDELKLRAKLYDEDAAPSQVVAESWFAANKKHGLLARHGVGTIDQALLAVLQTKHVFVRLFGLAGKCVILDEVHAYDTYMATLMERLLAWLAALGCPVVLLSATLPAERRRKLIKAYAGSAAASEYTDAPYPRVTTWRQGIGTKAEHVKHDTSRERTVRLSWVKNEALASSLSAALANGGCAAVIRNTVGLAQATFAELKNSLSASGIHVELFHARFPFGRRKKIEDDVLEKLGKGPDGKPANPLRPAKYVLVATQVIEQSLDLDFDLMVSDVAPVDLVLQRAGRLWRHERGRRSLAEAQLWLIEPETDANDLPQFGVNGLIYDRHILYRTLTTLYPPDGTPRTVLHLPADLQVLIDEVYGERSPPTGLTAAQLAYWHDTKRKMDDCRNAEEAEADHRRIKKPRFRGPLARVVGETPGEEDNPELHPAHQALTRLAPPSALLICLCVESYGTYRPPHGSATFASVAVRKLSAGGIDDIKRLLEGELSTAHPGIVRMLWNEPRRPTAWKEVGMLCRHHLVEFVDGNALIGQYRLRLSDDIGLTVEKVGDDSGEDE